MERKMAEMIAVGAVLAMVVLVVLMGLGYID